MFKKYFLFVGLLLTGSGLISCVGSSAGGSVFGGNTSQIVLKSTDELYQFLTYDEQRYPLISAHRGGPGVGLPENAIETFEQRSKIMALLIECDIRLTKDSVLVLMHDEKIDRTTTGKGRVKDLTWQELQAFNLKDNEGNVTDFKIPSLDQALKWGKNRVVFTLDVKREVPYAMVVDAIQRNQAEPFSIVITYNAEQVAEVHRLDPDLMISASIRMAGDLLRLNDRNIPDNRLVAFVGTSEIESGMYDLLHGHGIMCILGTMGNLDKQAKAGGDQVYAELVERGADILSTDRPEEAEIALKYYRKKRQITSSFIQ